MSATRLNLADLKNERSPHCPFLMAAKGLLRSPRSAPSKSPPLIRTLCTLPCTSRRKSSLLTLALEASAHLSKCPAMGAHPSPSAFQPA